MINYDCPAKHVAPFVQKIIIFPAAKKTDKTDDGR